jgi:hypothetical protein
MVNVLKLKFLLTGVLLLSAVFIGERTDGGRLAEMTGRGKQHSEAGQRDYAAEVTKIVLRWDGIDKGYLYRYGLTEGLYFAVCALTIGYYLDLLDSTPADLVKNYLTNYLHRKDPMIAFFPRLISCSDTKTSENGGIEITNVKCRVNSADLNEMFHIIALITSIVAMCALFCNLFYTVLCFLRIRRLVKDSKKANAQKLKGLSVNQKLILLLLEGHMDYFSHLYLIENLTQTPSLKPPN